MGKFHGFQWRSSEQKPGLRGVWHGFGHLGTVEGFFFFPGDRMDILDELPSGYVKIAIENDHL